MKAVFESDTPYLQVARSAFFETIDIYCEEGTYYSESGTPVHIDCCLVGEAYEVPPEGDKIYIFQEGEKHNRLTLTNPKEIAGMMMFIRCRDYVRVV